MLHYSHPTGSGDKYMPIIPKQKSIGVYILEFLEGRVGLEGVPNRHASFGADVVVPETTKDRG